MQYTADVASQYARYRGPRQDVVQALIDGAQLSDKSQVLEVGCGTGNFCIALVAQIGCHCEGLDPSEGMLAQARERDPRMPFVQGPRKRCRTPMRASICCFRSMSSTM